MLQTIRNNVQGVVAKVIIIFICATFALFGVDTLLGFSSSRDVAAKVNGEEISKRELALSADLRRRQLMARMGEDLDPELLDETRLRREALEALVNRKLLLQLAEELDMDFSDDQVRALLRGTPEFQTDGKFDQALFDSIVREQGMSNVQFAKFVREEMLMAQVRAGFMESSFLTEGELARMVALENQTRDIAWITLDALASGRDQEVSDEDIQQWYDQHQERYMTEELVSVRYLMLDRNELAARIEIAEEDVVARYDEERAATDLQAERHARHILVQVDGKRSEEEARQRADALRQRLLDGEDFAELARAESEDAGTAEMGGDLGFIGRGMFNPKFEEPMFSLQPLQISEPIRTGFGYHLVQVLEERVPEMPSLAEMRDALVAELRSAEVEQVFADKAQQLAERSYEAGDLRDPAEALGLDIRETGLFSRTDGTGLAANDRFRAAAFSAEVKDEGLNSTLIELDADRQLVLRIAEHKPAELRPLDEVRGAVLAAVQRERGKAVVAEQADSLMERLSAGEGADALALESGASVHTKKAAGRVAKDVPAQVLREAFRLPAPEAGEQQAGRVDLGNGDSFVVIVTAVQEGRTLADYGPAERSRLVEFHHAVRGGQAFDAVRRQIERTAEIERF